MKTEIIKVDDERTHIKRKEKDQKISPSNLVIRLYKEEKIIFINYDF